MSKVLFCRIRQKEVTKEVCEDCNARFHCTTYEFLKREDSLDHDTTEADRWVSMSKEQNSDDVQMLTIYLDGPANQYYAFCHICKQYLDGGNDKEWFSHMGEHIKNQFQPILSSNRKDEVRK